MRVLQFCGVAEEFSKGIRPHPGTDFRGLDGQVIKLFDPLPPPWDLGWPPTFTFVQPEMERLLREALVRRETVTLLLGHSVEGFRDEGDRVCVDILDLDTGGTRTVTGDFLIGCDGANSGVRAALGLPLEDLGFDENWLVVDALQRRETAIPAKGTQFCWPWRPASFIPGPGKLRRWELKIMPGETPAEFDDPARVRAVLADHVDTGAVEIWRSATYRFAARVGTEWRKGRVLLAGDAIHQTPPFLGQGLGSGIRDAANLAWKLVHIRRTGFNAALLDSYRDERRPHVVAVVEAAKEFGKIVGELDMDRARARDAELAAELASGRMETRRQKFIPDLETGILDPEPGVPWADQVAGKLMIQPEVYAPDGSKRLLDDIVPMEWLYITAGLEEQRWMEGVEDVWQAIGGRRSSSCWRRGGAVAHPCRPGESGRRLERLLMERQASTSLTDNVKGYAKPTTALPASGTIMGFNAETSCALIGLRGRDQRALRSRYKGEKAGRTASIETDGRFARWCNFLAPAIDAPSKLDAKIRPDRLLLRNCSICRTELFVLQG